MSYDVKSYCIILNYIKLYHIILYYVISNHIKQKKKQYIVLFLVDLCNMGFHSAAVQKLCPTPSTNQPSKFAQLLQLRLGELPGLDVRLRRNEGGIVGGCFNEIQ